MTAAKLPDFFNDEATPQSADSIAEPQLTPRVDWTEMDRSAHFAQFYESDECLLNSLSGFIREGLEAGDAGIVLATDTHRAGLEERLRALGIDLVARAAAGQYVSLDGSETLSKLMVDNTVEPKRFVEVVGSIVARAGGGGRHVRIFGELVALLWAAGNRAAAVQLEQLWNRLHEIHPFVLFCGYPLKGFVGEALVQPLIDVCKEHSRVIPAESYNALSSADDRLRVILQLQQKAKTLEAEVTERKGIEERLRASLAREQIAREEAEQANRLKDEFLATVSHELRTPLNAIVGWTHVLRRGGLDEAGSVKAIETIERNAKSQAQLIEDILDVSRAITGKFRLSIGPVDIASVINAATDSVHLAAESKGIQIAVSLDPAARHVSGDAGRLQQVVWNLLSNAIKFTPSGGRVQVRLEQSDSNAQISVCDTGQGISPDFLPFIFDRFRQADGTSTRRHGGLGLGLAIVRHLVELHGGTVYADSPGEGGGATFTIRLPLVVVDERVSARRNTGGLLSVEETPGRLRTLASLEGVRVLLVDDDHDTLTMLAIALREYRSTVETASSVAEALDACRWYKPQVLVSDLAMPDEDGYALIKSVRTLEVQTGQQILAVALTAYVRVEDRTRALSAGFNMFVPKPVQPDELIAAIANLVQCAEPALERL